MTCEFEREVLNEVIYSKVEHLPINIIENIIHYKGYSDVIKFFCVTALEVRFLLKIYFGKMKYDNLSLSSYVDANEIYQVKVIGKGQ